MRDAGSLFAIIALLCCAAPPPLAAEWLAPEGWRPLVVRGGDLACFRGRKEENLVVVACRERCQAIPFQLDERDAAGNLVLDAGPQPGVDAAAPGLDANDEIVVMGRDLGRRARPGEIPVRACGREVRVVGSAGDGWFYVLGEDPAFPASRRRYVDYDPATDVMTAPRVAIGFGAATPRTLLFRPLDGGFGPDLLDRLKIRASARFFGFLPLGRDEDDIESRYAAWRTGAIRVVRREEKWVRLGFGLRTPIFRSDTTFYPDYVEIPVRLRLNFPPAHFFAAIEIRALLDFVDLRGWRIAVPGDSFSGVVGSVTRAQRKLLANLDSDSVALVGDEIAAVLALDLGDSLASLRRRILYREDGRARAPEGVAGEMPGIGFRLTDWEAIASGNHQFTATSYVLPADCDLARFQRERRRLWSIEVRDLRAPP